MATGQLDATKTGIFRAKTPEERVEWIGTQSRYQQRPNNPPPALPTPTIHAMVSPGPEQPFATSTPARYVQPNAHARTPCHFANQFGLIGSKALFVNPSNSFALIKY